MEYANGGEELMNSTEPINTFKYRNKDGAKMWTFDKTTIHRKLTDSTWEVKLLWYTG